MLVLVERGMLDQAAQIDVEIVDYLKSADKQDADVQAFVKDLLAAYRSLQGKLAVSIDETKSELIGTKKAQKNVKSLYKATGY